MRQVGGGGGTTAKGKEETVAGRGEQRIQSGRGAKTLVIGGRDYGDGGVGRE